MRTRLTAAVQETVTQKGIELEVKKKITPTDVFHLLLCGYIPTDLQLLFCFRVVFFFSFPSQN